MQTLHNPVRKTLAGLIREAAEKLAPGQAPSLEDIAQALTDAPSLDIGHAAFPCFPLAKALKKAPPVIAKELKAQLSAHPLVRESKEVGPYLNFFMDPAALGPLAADPILSGEAMKRALLTDPQRIMVEYSQPNTHKELHVGHMRGLCLGNAVVRLNQYAGNTVYAVTFPGDMGTHVAKCLWYWNKNKLVPPEGPKGAWLGQIYSKANNLLEDQKGTPQEDLNRAELTAILKQLEHRSGPYYDQWKESREWSLDLMKGVYEWADVEFTRWFYESECDAPSLEMARKLHKEGKLIESEGAIGMDMKEDKLGFCMLIKSDGTGLYATKDVLLAQLKHAEYKMDKNIYVVDKRQALHFKQVFKVLERLNLPYFKGCYHLEYDVVELPDGAMSSRKGNIVPMMALIDGMQAFIKKEYLERYKGEWPEAEIDGTAKLIANGAIKYGMIRMDNNRKIVFDLKEWLKLDGETGPYLQYVCARINSLGEKLDAKKELEGAIPWAQLKLPQEEALLVKLSQMNDVIASAAVNYKTPLLCAYLYELGKLYNAFYHDCPVGKAETPELKKARLALSLATGKAMQNGLSLLGIQAPKRM